MEKQNQNYTEDDALKNEPPVRACELLEEIKPLLADYFEGRISFDGNALTYCLPNGQRFRLSAVVTA